MPDVLVTVGVVLLVIAIADFVTLWMGKTPPPTECKMHDWFEVVDQEEKHLNFICGVCKKTPAMIRGDVKNEG